MRSDRGPVDTPDPSASAPLADAQVALQHLTAPPPRRRWGQFGIALAILALAFAGLQLAANVSDNAKGLRDSKRADRRMEEAIRVTCTLLSNAITMSGGGSQDTGGPSRRLSAQQRLSAKYIAIITRSATPHERVVIRRLVAEVARSGGGLPDCREAAVHPDRVHLIPPPSRANP